MFINEVVAQALKDHPQLTTVVNMVEGKVAALEKELRERDKRIQVLENKIIGINSKLAVQKDELDLMRIQNKKILEKASEVAAKARTIEAIGSITWAIMEVLLDALPWLRWIGKVGKYADMVADHFEDAIPRDDTSLVDGAPLGDMATPHSDKRRRLRLKDRKRQGD